MIGLSDTIGRKIILRHFPDADPAVIERHALWLSPPAVASLPPNNFVKEGRELDRQIDEFKDAIRAAWRAYQEIPLHVRRDNGVDWVAFAKLARAAGGEALRGQEPIARPPAIEVMRRNARKADRLSPQAMAAGHPAKIALVEKARAAWRDLAGADAPLKPSDGAAFLKFVQDVIDGAGKPWGAEKTLAAWRTAETNLAG